MHFEQELKELQRQLAQVDLLTRANGQSSADYIKFLVLKLKDIKIRMYQEVGHHFPHIHIDYGHDRHVASYSIENGERLAGTLDRKYDKVVATWLEKYRTQLLEVWHAAQTVKTPSHWLHKSLEIKAMHNKSLQPTAKPLARFGGG